MVTSEREARIGRCSDERRVHDPPDTRRQCRLDRSLLQARALRMLADRHQEHRVQPRKRDPHPVRVVIATDRRHLSPGQVRRRPTVLDDQPLPDSRPRQALSDAPAQLTTRISVADPPAHTATRPRSPPARTRMALDFAEDSANHQRREEHRSRAVAFHGGCCAKVPTVKGAGCARPRRATPSPARSAASLCQAAATAVSRSWWSLRRL
jgi:hypothetical protein